MKLCYPKEGDALNEEWKVVEKKDIGKCMHEEFKEGVASYKPHKDDLSYDYQNK